jgi:hypothetical protein
MPAGTVSNQSPTLPSGVPSPTPPAVVTNFEGDALVTSSDGSGACGPAVHAGETRERITWQVTTTGSHIELIEGPLPFPNDNTIFTGTVDGDAFAATENLVNLDLGSRGMCDFRRADVVGSFSADRQQFDATETLLWGPPNDRTTIVRHWSVTRRP